MPNRHCRNLVRDLETNLGGTVAARATYTQLANAASVPVTDNQLVTVPATSGVLVPVASPYNTILIDIVLSDADKLAVGKTLLLNSFFSLDSGATWQFINGFNWRSYGPGGLTVTDPDGAVHVNPGPRLYVPLNGVKGQLTRIQYQAVGISTAGVIISGVS